MGRIKNRYFGIQKWLRSQQGQTFMNFAYSWGASVVIAGALFKLTHIAGADLMLFIGMGTEVVIFFLAGFEPQEALDDYGETIPDEQLRAEMRGTTLTEETAAALAAAANNGGSGGPVIIGGMPGGSVTGGTSDSSQEPTPVTIAGASEPTPVTIVNAAELAENISTAPVFNSPQFRGMTPEMQEATKLYVEQLTELTEVLRQVAEQSARLTRDSEEMETMNRTLTGINRFYELQLKSVGTQSATIDDVNEQTKKLAAQLQELNEVYAKMVEALKVKIA